MLEHYCFSKKVLTNFFYRNKFVVKSLIMKKILILEDDVDTLDLMEFILNDNGYIVIKVNRDISVKEVAAIKPELVIIDFLLTFGLGTELCKNIKSDERTQYIPVIIYSANSGVKQLAIDNGANAYLDKPFDVDDLLRLVDRTILKTYTY